MTPPGSHALIHQALLFDSSEQFLASAVPFLVDGLRQGDTVIAVTSEASAELLRKHLEGDADQVTFLDTARWFDTPGRALAAYHREVDALGDRHDRLRVVGEPVRPGLDQLESEQWGSYESALNVAFASSPAWLMCGYDCRSLPSETVDDARRTHPELRVNEHSQRSEEYQEPAAYYAERNVALSPRPEHGVETLMDFGTLAPVRRFVESHAVRLGLPADRLDDFTLAVNEIATNALRHGGGQGIARLWANARRVTCEITDLGTAPSRFLGFLRAGPNATSGHGLWIARQLCDLLEMHTGEPGTTIRLHIRRAM